MGSGAAEPTEGTFAMSSDGAQFTFTPSAAVTAAPAPSEGAAGAGTDAVAAAASSTTAVGALVVPVASVESVTVADIRGGGSAPADVPDSFDRRGVWRFRVNLIPGSNPGATSPVFQTTDRMVLMQCALGVPSVVQTLTYARRDTGKPMPAAMLMWQAARLKLLDLDPAIGFAQAVRVVEAVVMAARKRDAGKLLPPLSVMLPLRRNDDALADAGILAAAVVAARARREAARALPVVSE